MAGPNNRPEAKSIEIAYRLICGRSTTSRRFGWYFKRKIKKYLWPRPILFSPIAFWLHRDNLLNLRFDLLIDGFPRSANTFAAEAFRLSQPNLEILTHRHMSAYVIQAVRTARPVCLLIRPPLDAIASCVVFSRWSIEYTIDSYVDYYEPLLDLAHRCIVADFAQITEDLPTIVRSLNMRYGLGLAIPAITQEFISRVRANVREYPWSGDPLRVSLPAEERKELLERIKGALKRPEYKESMDRASRLYLEITNSA